MTRLLTRELWALYTDNHPTIHTNRFGTYDSFTETQLSAGVAAMIAEMTSWGISPERIDAALKGEVTNEVTFAALDYFENDGFAVYGDRWIYFQWDAKDHPTHEDVLKFLIREQGIEVDRKWVK
jgi:hypothetical protein